MKRNAAYVLWGVAFGMALTSLFEVRTAATVTGVALGLWLLALMNHATLYRRSWRAVVFSAFYLIYTIQVL
ncbi:MAG: hypothetical protein IRZ33_05605 [Alicyclobacillaceae bacterium]|nr:hypothetical protein [Alicyclobacillaceae bacterium]